MGAMNPSGGATSRALYLRLLRHVWPYRAALFASIVAMIVGGLADAAVVKLLGPLITGSSRSATASSRSCCRSAWWPCSW